MNDYKENLLQEDHADMLVIRKTSKESQDKLKNDEEIELEVENPEFVHKDGIMKNRIDSTIRKK
jgi:hypothetical protein